MASNQASLAVSRAPKHGKKYFTVSEANRALPYVSKIVEDVTAQYKLTVSVRDRLENPDGDEPIDQLRGEYERSLDRLNELMDELSQVGVQLKDFDKGLLDFPAWHQGREIDLCWRRGESKVAHWHELGAGYAGRQAVATLEAEEELPD